ncbi:MAG: HAD-IB family phosphatase [Methanomassiliicoccales archaeon]
MDLAVVSDFDGTLVEIDTVDHIMERFAQGDWRYWDDLYNRREISIQECLRHQFPMVKLSRERIIKELDEMAFPRSHFQDLIGYLRSSGSRLTVASAGFDFYIDHFLESRGLDEVEYLAPRTIFTGDGLDIEFPTIRPGFTNHKDELVGRLRSEGKTVAYLGNGTSDLEATRLSDIPLVVRGSTLARLCREEGVDHHTFDDFIDVIGILSGI